MALIVLPPVISILVPTSCRLSAGQSAMTEGAPAKTLPAAAPMVPVLPLIVTVITPPSSGGFGPTTVVSTLFEFAEIVESASSENWTASPFWTPLPSPLPPGGVGAAVS